MSRHPLVGKLLAALLCMILSAMALPAASQTHDDQAPAGAGRPRFCPQAGCTSGVTLLSDLPLAAKALRQARIRVCRNDTCLSGDFRGLRGSLTVVGRGAHMVLPWDPQDPQRGELPSGSPRVDVVVSATVSGVLSLAMNWATWSDREPQDGDVYRLTSFNARGTQVFALHETVPQYHEFYPNGKACPPMCRGAHRDRRQRTQP